MSKMIFTLADYKDALERFRAIVKADIFPRTTRQVETFDHVTTRDVDVSADTGKPQPLTFLADDADPFDLSDDPKMVNGKVPNGVCIGLFSHCLDIPQMLTATATAVEKASAEAIMQQGYLELKNGGERETRIAGLELLNPIAQRALSAADAAEREQPPTVHKVIHPEVIIVPPGGEWSAVHYVDGTLFANAPTVVDDDFKLRLRTHMFILRNG